MSDKSKLVESDSLGMTQIYNSDNRNQLWEGSYGTKAKKNYKDKAFGYNQDGSYKQTYVDPITGKTLHKSHNAAKNKYHAKNSDGEKVSSAWSEYASEVDHKVALKDAHDIAKHNPFVSDSDFKKIMNSEENLRILPKSENASKGEKSDWDLVFSRDSKYDLEGRTQLAKEKIATDVALHGKFAIRTAQNMKPEFGTGAKDALISSIVPLTAEAISKMVDVAQRKESFEDASKEFAKATVNVAVAGGNHKLLIDTVNHTLASSNNPLLKGLANSAQVGQLVAIASVVQESAVKYINGEISGEEFVDRIGKKGTVMTASMMGGKIGGEIGTVVGGILGTITLPGAGSVGGAVSGRVIGEILGTITTTVACSAVVTVFSTVKHMEDYKLTENHVQRIEKDALNEMKRQREKFKEIVEHEFDTWDTTIESGFDQILSCACKETFNLCGVTDGIDKILSLFGKTVAFKNVEEYEAQLDSTLKLKF